MLETLVSSLSPDGHVLIAGPTASGKSALALAIAARQGGLIVNADALQVYDCWRVISARPSAAEEAQAPHALYGIIGPRTPWSVGHWLRAVADLQDRGQRLIVVGGTGLYFSALTEGLAEVPPVPAPHTIQRGTGCGSRSICAKIDSAILLLPRQSVARSA